MYARDCPRIAAEMRSDPVAFKRGVYFVICSIRQRIENVPDQLERVWAGDWSDLFASKRDAASYILEHGDALWDSVRDAPLEAAILRLCDIPGIGIVKAAFICQLMGHDVACLDSRNVARLKLKPRAFATNGRKTGKAHLAKVRRYLKATRGKSEIYWDDWCADVANRSSEYGTAELVSALHCAIIQRTLADTF